MTKKPFLLILLCLHSLASLAQPVKQGDDPAVRKFITAVEANPEDVKAHQAYIRSVDHNVSKLQPQYNAWMKKFPKSITVPLMIGKTLSHMERPEARQYLLRVVELAPERGEAWDLLALDASRLGNDSLFRHYQLKAVASDRNNAGYAFGYAFSFREDDKQKFDSLMLDIALRLRGTDEEARAYYWLAETEPNKEVRRIYYRQLENIFRQGQSERARTGMSEYFSFLINDEPEQAFGLALNMIQVLKTRVPEWKHKMEVAKAFVDARGLLGRGEPEQALNVLRSVRLRNPFVDSYIEADDKLRLLKAEAQDAASRTQTAYDSLLVHYSSRPSAKFYEALQRYGGKLGKDSITIRKEVLDLRNAGARAAEQFSLVNYLNGEKVSLGDQAGKVVLLTFWFPGCGPCRAEFPHFENVIRKFRKQEVAYLGINGILDQGGYVVPFLKGTGYSFTPLEEDPGRKMDVLTTRAYPRNFLLDHEGRVIFSDFRIDDKNEEMLERMIRELLEARTGTQAGQDSGIGK